MKRGRVSRCRMLALLFFLALPVAGQDSLSGRWEGELVREGSVLGAAFEFTRGASGPQGTFSARSMRVLGIPLANVRLDARQVHFELVGDASTIVFDGELDGETLTGIFREREATGVFRLRRVPPQPPLYREEEVSFENGDARLSGTVFLPVAEGRHPAVLFLHGSGPEGRSASRFLADHLARNGIAALIYDKRGVGASSGDWRRSDFEALAADAMAGIHLLERRPEIDPRKIGLYGHSQGGSIGPLVAARSQRVAFVISAAGGGLPMHQSEVFSLSTQLPEDLSAEERAEAMAYIRLMVHVARTGEKWEEFTQAIERARRKEWFAALEPPPRDHWFWSFFPGIADYTPAAFWEKVTVPVLLIYGERDARVPVGESIAANEQALRRANNPDFTIVVLPRADHALRIRPEPGRPFEWPSGASGFPELLSAWIRLRFSPAR